MNATTASDPIVQQITIHAPAARVFAALTTPDQCVKWWGIEGRFQSTRMESDLRPGGKWVVYGKRADGGDFTVRGKYREVAPPSLLAFTWLPDWAAGATESLVRFELNETDGLTTVRLTHSGLSSDAARAQHQGWPVLLANLRSLSEQTLAS